MTFPVFIDHARPYAMTGPGLGDKMIDYSQSLQDMESVMSAPPPFAHLHCHSHYSLLDGAGKIRNLLTRAQALRKAFANPFYITL
ncbi:MAG: PHP domain-containing protein, partial [Thermoguttaceae bacterium]